MLKIKRCTFLPLLELDFIRDHINYVLNKNELKNIYTSKVIISFYKNNLEKFINDFSTKIKNDEALKEKINSYIDNYNIYFCKLPTHTMALTIFKAIYTYELIICKIILKSRVSKSYVKMI